MSDKVWYRSSDWDSEAQETFKKKIRRARSNKVSYTLTKARVLYGTGEEDKAAGAKALLEAALSEYRDEPFDVPDMAQTLVRWYLKDEDFASAEKFIDEYFRLIAEGKSGRVQKGASPHELKAELLMLSGDREKSLEAVALIDRWHADRDLKNGNAVPYIPRFGTMRSMTVKDHDGRKVDSIDHAWDGFEIAHSDLDYDILHAKNRESLEYLWRHLSEVSRSEEYRISAYDWYDLKEAASVDHPDTIEYKQMEGDLFRYIPELGAYIGQVLVNEFAGRWEECRPLMESAVILDGGRIDPFRIAYYVVVYRFPLNRVVDGIEILRYLFNDADKR